MRAQAAEPPASPAGRAPERVCPHFHRAVELVGRRWSGAILYSLTGGRLRFAELKAAVPGMSDRLLSARLKELEQAGLVDREVHPGTPVRVSYELTAKGESLGPVIGSLGDWARHHRV
ncbi:MAG: transcriptional regulator [Solirubrobacterales bacterium]|nr:transcriptional regulator [Solirubrobacterales bacterium]